MTDFELGIACGLGGIMLLVGLGMWAFDAWVIPWLEKYDRGHR